MIDDDLHSWVSVRAEPWPEFGEFSDVVCDVVALDDRVDAIVLGCHYPPTGEVIEIEVRVPSTLMDDQLAGLAGTTDLRASFYHAMPLTGFGCTPYCNEFALREADGSLILLGRFTFPVLPDPGGATELPGPPWLRAGSAESDAWSLPLQDLSVRDVGCDARDGDLGLIVPLELAFGGDDGLVSVGHGSEVMGISVGGGSFDFLVRAYHEQRPAEEGAETIVAFVAVRSLP